MDTWIPVGDDLAGKLEIYLFEHDLKRLIGHKNSISGTDVKASSCVHVNQFSGKPWPFTKNWRSIREVEVDIMRLDTDLSLQIEKVE